MDGRWLQGSTAEHPVPFIHAVHRPPYAEMSITRTAEGLRASVGEETAFILPDGINPPLSYKKEMSLEDASGAAIVRGEPDGDLRFRQEEVFVLGNAFELRRDARAFAATVAALRNAIGYNRLIYAPGIMEPSNLALLVYMGVDLVDSSLLVYQGSRGRLLLPEGVMNASDAEWMSSEDGAVQHNLDAAWKELQLVRHMIRTGRLRELAENRAHSTPWGGPRCVCSIVSIMTIRKDTRRSSVRPSTRTPRWHCTGLTYGASGEGSRKDGPQRRTRRCCC